MQQHRLLYGSRRPLSPSKATRNMHPSKVDTRHFDQRGRLQTLEPLPGLAGNLGRHARLRRRRRNRHSLAIAGTLRNQIAELTLQEARRHPSHEPAP